jgi:hypothetical protein
VIKKKEEKHFSPRVPIQDVYKTADKIYRNQPQLKITDEMKTTLSSSNGLLSPSDTAVLI